MNADTVVRTPEISLSTRLSEIWFTAIASFERDINLTGAICMRKNEMCSTRSNEDQKRSQIHVHMLFVMKMYSL